MKLSCILILLALSCMLLPLASGSVVINEVELNDLQGAPEMQWIELYNSGNDDVDISGWYVVPNDDRLKKEFILDGTVIAPKGFYVIGFYQEWMDKYGAVVILEDDDGREKDRTPYLYDSQQDICAWGRYPDGVSGWQSMISSQGEPNSGELCDEVAVRATVLSIEGSTNGTGYVNIRNIAAGPNGDTILSKEHGSGDYNSEGSIDYHFNEKTLIDDIDLSNNTQIQNIFNQSWTIYIGTIDLSKQSLFMRYNNTENNLPNNRVAQYKSRWTESTEVKSKDVATKIAQSTRYASNVSKELDMGSQNSDLYLNISSGSEGKSSISYCSDYFSSREEYEGGFNIEETISEGVFNRSAATTTGSGFVAVYKKFGKDMATYEKGSGSYRVEEQIDSDSDYMARDIWLNYSPSRYVYSPTMAAARSVKWSEGIIFNASDDFYMSESFTDLDRLEKHIVVASLDEVKTSADFIGQARLRTALKSENNSSDRAYIDDEYEGSYRIEKKIVILPKYDRPHLSMQKYGYIDPDDCNKLRFSILLENDGNRTLGPIYVRDTFPSGSHLTAYSMEPFELTRSYGNWSIPALGSGQSTSINLEFEISTRRQNYTNRARAVTDYQTTVRGLPVLRKIRASNSTTVEADWDECPYPKLSAELTATVSDKDKRIVSYRLTLNNSADYNISANITALLPPGMRFINSTTKPLQTDSGNTTVKWTIKKIDAGKKRSISFMAEAERDGLFNASAYVQGSSIENGDQLFADSNAIIVVGKAVFGSVVDYGPECLSCDDDAMTRTIQTAQAGTAKELSCCA